MRKLALVFLILLMLAGFAQAQSLTLAWKDNSSNEDGFRIQRKLGTAGTFVDLKDVGVNVTMHLDTTTLADTEYCYRLSSFNLAGASASTNEVCGTAVSLPNVPTDATVIQIQTTIIISP